jgi:RHS repeat-associated protein
MRFQPSYNQSFTDPYSFQAQEHDDEVKGDGNSVNYKYRMHDPRLGRFFAVDPMASSYPFYSPYAFSGNRVIDAFELEGLQPEAYESRTKQILNNVEKHGVITKTDQEYINQKITERHYALFSEIVFFTSKPYSSEWARSQRQSTNDLGLNIRNDIYETGEKKAGYYGVSNDNPRDFRIYIPEESLLKVVENYPRKGTVETSWWNASSGIYDQTVSGAIYKSNTSLLSPDAFNKLTSDWESKLTTEKPEDINPENYKVIINARFNNGTSQNVVDARVNQLKKIATDNGFKEENIEVITSYNEPTEDEYVSIKTGSSQEIVKE